MIKKYILIFSSLIFISHNLFAISVDSSSSGLSNPIGGDLRITGGLNVGTFATATTGQGFFSGKVGIGTSTPNQLLSLLGTSNAYLRISPKLASQTSGIFLLTPGVGSWEISNTSTVLSIIESGVATRMTFKGANVGVGSTNPQHKLSVAGNLGVTGNQYIRSGSLSVGTSLVGTTGQIKSSGSIITSGNISVTGISNSKDCYAQYCVTYNALTFTPTQAYTTYNIGIAETMLLNATYSDGVVTLQKAGTYLIGYSGCMDKENDIDDIEGGISITAGAAPDPCSEFKFDSAASGFNYFGGKLLLHNVNANDKLSFKIKNITSNTRTVTLRNFNLIIERRYAD